MSDDEVKDDGHETIPVHIRLYHDGSYVVADGEEMDDDAETLHDRAEHYRMTGPFREFIIHARAKRPAPPQIEAHVDVPDEPQPVIEPATATVAA